MMKMDLHLQQGEQGDHTHLIEHLASRYPHERLAAEELLAEGNTQTVEALIQVLERENKKKKWRFAVGFAIGFVPLLALQVLMSRFLHIHGFIGGAIVPIGT